MNYDLSEIFPITQNKPLVAQNAYDTSYTPASKAVSPTLDQSVSAKLSSYSTIDSVNGRPGVSYVNETPVTVQPKSDFLGIIDSISGLVKTGTGIYNSIKSTKKPPVVSNIPVQVVSGTPAKPGQQGITINQPTNPSNTTGSFGNFVSFDSTTILIIAGVLIIALFLSRK